MAHFNIFATEYEYNLAKDTLIEPNVSLITSTGEVKYKPDTLNVIKPDGPSGTDTPTALYGISYLLKDWQYVPELNTLKLIFEFGYETQTDQKETIVDYCNSWVRLKYNRQTLTPITNYDVDNDVFTMDFVVNSTNCNYIIYEGNTQIYTLGVYE